MISSVVLAILQGAHGTGQLGVLGEEGHYRHAGFDPPTVAARPVSVPAVPSVLDAERAESSRLCRVLHPERDKTEFSMWSSSADPGLSGAGRPGLPTLHTQHLLGNGNLLCPGGIVGGGCVGCAAEASPGLAAEL